MDTPAGDTDRALALSLDLSRPVKNSTVAVTAAAPATPNRMLAPRALSDALR
jgi:hypothetical protein